MALVFTCMRGKPKIWNAYPSHRETELRKYTRRGGGKCWLYYFAAHLKTKSSTLDSIVFIQLIRVGEMLR